MFASRIESVFLGLLLAAVLVCLTWLVLVVCAAWVHPREYLPWVAVGCGVVAAMWVGGR